MVAWDDRLNERVNESMRNGWFIGQMNWNEWLVGLGKKDTDGKMNEWVNECINGWANKFIYQMNEKMNGWMNEWIANGRRLTEDG